MIGMEAGTEPSVLPKRLGVTSALQGTLVAGTYRVGRLLARGGMGEIHEAEHVRLRTAVAMKVLRANLHDDARASERFRAEARRLAAVRSEHVVRVFDCGELDDGTPYLVMDHLVGEDVRALLEREGALPVRRAVNLIVGACRGLTAVHRMGLVHRDLKPANLFIEVLPDGTESCKILDFGVAKALENDTTRPGALVGTVRYMAPEQLENPSSATARADVYALGTILFECLTGSPARTGGTLEETMFEILHGDVPRPASRRPLPAELDAVVTRALAREPAARFASASELERALLPFGKVSANHRLETESGDETSREGVNGVPVGARSSVASRRALLLGVAVFGLGALGGWILRSSRNVVPARAAAQVVQSAAFRAASAPALPPAPLHPNEPAANGATRAAADASAASTLLSAPRSARSSRPHPSSKSTPPAVRTSPADSRFDPNDPYQ